MALPASLAAALKRERMPYLVYRHPPAYTAQEMAAASHTPGRCAVKVVICIADDRPVQAVVPAHYLVDLERLRDIARVETLRLAKEDEIAAFYPDFEVGAAPPFGSCTAIAYSWSSASSANRRWSSTPARTPTRSACTTRLRGDGEAGRRHFGVRPGRPRVVPES